MDHSEVREILEDAAIEPGGLERLMAGDTPTSSLVAGHLTGCPDCADELERLRRSVALIRPGIAAIAPPELRERTLAFVAALGRPRGEAAQAPMAPAQDPDPAHAAAAPATAAAPAAAANPIPLRRSARLAPLLGIAAALVLAVTGSALVTNASRDAELRHQAAEIEALGDVARWTLRLDRQPDVQRVALVSAGGGSGNGPTGELTWSPGSTELVVVADGLPPAAAGHEYRCWVEENGTRTPIGKMFFGGDVAYWVGPVPAIGKVGSTARFVVSLVDLAAPNAPSEPVLTGTT